MQSPIISGMLRPSDTGLYYEVHQQLGNENTLPLLLLHGNGESVRVFDPFLPALAENRTVIALDTRGHGKSGRGEKPFDFSTFAQDTGGVMEQLETPRAILVGYSDGASTAMHLALTQPQKVAGLVLLGANLSPKGVKRQFQLPLVMGYRLCAAIARVNKSARAKCEQLALMVQHPNLTLQQIRAITAPTLVLAGEKDIIRPEHTEAIAGAIPHAEMAILPGETHFSLIKSPRTLERITKFLCRLPG